MNASAASVESWLGAQSFGEQRVGLLVRGEIVDEWRVEAYLGRGLSAEVYRVTNVRFGHDGALKTAALLNPKRHAVWLWMMQCEYPGRINRWHQYKVWRPVVNRFFEQNTGKGSNGETP